MTATAEPVQLTSSLDHLAIKTPDSFPNSTDPNPRSATGTQKPTSQPSDPPSPPKTLPPLTASDLNDLNTALFHLFDSYDTKDWPRLSTIITPTLNIDHRGLGMSHWPEMPAAEYLAMVSSPLFMGDPTTACQHLTGATCYTRTAEDEVEGRHQIRAAVQVYTDETRTVVRLKGRAHASNVHWYRRVDGVWKFAGLRPKVLFLEEDFERVWRMAGKRDDDGKGASGS